MSNLGSIIASAQQSDRRREYLRRTSPYYPDYIILEDEGIMYISTILRMEKDGKWYKVHFIETGMQRETEKEMLTRSIKKIYTRFIKKIYIFQQLGTIDPNLKDPLGRVIFPLDENQQPEPQRMEELLNGPKRKTS